MGIYSELIFVIAILPSPHKLIASKPRKCYNYGKAPFSHDLGSTLIPTLSVYVYAHTLSFCSKKPFFIAQTHKDMACYSRWKW